MKISYNKVFGYYLEVSNANKDKVPTDWIRKQTLVNAERYITEELKTYEEKILNAEDKIVVIEQKLFMTRNREHKLRELLDVISKGYDFVLIDCPPNLGNLTDNALNAAQRVVVPIQAETSSVRAVDLLFDQIESVEQGLKIKIDVLGLAVAWARLPAESNAQPPNTFV